MQLRPTNAFSLLDNFSTTVTDKDVPAEYQMAAKLFMQTPLCFELVTTNRFKDARLRRLLEFMRNPGRKIPSDISEYWQLIQGKPDDPRFCEERFIFGHKLAIYWETVSPWMMQRARQDAAILRKPLYLLQAADTSTPVLTRDLAAKLMNAYNPQETGHMHGLFSLHEGMRVRLMVALDKDRGLVREAEGVVVHVVINPLDQPLVDHAVGALGAKKPDIYLKHVPLGVWVRMDKYNEAPFQQKLQKVDAGLLPSVTDSLVFVESMKTIKPFKWRDHVVTRVGWPLTHACVRTSTACQGKTLLGGIIVDCGRRVGGAHPTEDDDWWLHLYVMISRATRLDDLLLLRAPDVSFLLRGPPKIFKDRLALFDKRVKSCRVQAEQLAGSLGLARFLR